MSTHYLSPPTPRQLAQLHQLKVTDTADSEMADDREWGGYEDAVEDPEELRVIFCALDSYLLVENFLFFFAEEL